MIKKLLATALIIPAFTIGAANAQQPAEEKSDWSVVLGAGVIAAPLYEGSSDYVVAPIPFVNITYLDTISFGARGLTAKLIQRNNFEADLGLAIDGGRNEDGGSLLISADDDTLQGMGDIDPAVGVKAFASYDFDAVKLSSSITQFLGNTNDGLIVDAGLSKKIPLSRQLFLTPSIKATWADDNYTQTFFGVTPQQSARSQFSAYEAEAGFKDVSVGLNAMYFINRQWFVTANGSVKQLLYDAADSPISEDDTNISLITTIGYRF